MNDLAASGFLRDILSGFTPILRRHPRYDWVTDEKLKEALDEYEQRMLNGGKGDGEQSRIKHLCTIEEVAAHLRCSERQVLRLLAWNHLPRVRVGRRSTRIPESAVMQYIESATEGGEDDEDR